MSFRIYGVDTCPEHGLKYLSGSRQCNACVYYGELTSDLLEAFREHEKHESVATVLLVSRSCFDPRKHCFICSGQGGCVEGSD